MQKNCSILNHYYYWCILLFVYYFSINVNNSQKKLVLFWTRQLMAIWGAWWPWLPHRCQPAPVTSVTSQAVKPCETLRARCKHRNSWDLWMLPSGKLTKLWKITIFNGKINYKWAIFNSYVKLPEGIVFNILHTWINQG